jgi:hypothetical protein
MNIKRFIILILLVATTLYFLLPSDEKKIRNNLDSLAEYCSSSDKEGPIPALKKVTLAGKLCRYPCRVRVESFNLNYDFNKKDFTDHVLMLKKMTLNTQFSFHDTSIEFPMDTKANLVSTLRLDGKIKDDRFTNAYEINIEAEKNDGDWFFSSFTVVEFMEQ